MLVRMRSSSGCPGPENRAQAVPVPGMPHAAGWQDFCCRFRIFRPILALIRCFLALVSNDGAVSHVCSLFCHIRLFNRLFFPGPAMALTIAGGALPRLFPAVFVTQERLHIVPDQDADHPFFITGNEITLFKNVKSPFHKFLAVTAAFGDIPDQQRHAGSNR